MSQTFQYLEELLCLTSQRSRICTIASCLAAWRGLPGCHSSTCGSTHGLRGSKLAHMQVAWRTCSITQAIHLLGAAAVTWTIKMATRRTIQWRQITWTTAAAYCSTCDWLTMHMHSMLLSATLGRVSSIRAQRVSRACFYVAAAVTWVTQTATSKTTQTGQSV